MKTLKKAALSAAWLVLCLCASQTQASWLIDEAAFHISAHGQTSCAECHEGASKNDQHPDPANVNRKVLDFFSKDKCIQCHEEVEDDLARAFHGDRHLPDPSAYEACLNCHNPHTQLSLSAVREGRIKPGLQPAGQCAACHDAQESLPTPDKAQEACLSCHAAPTKENAKTREAVASLCLYCHDEGGPAAAITPSIRMPVLSRKAYERTRHADLSCLSCHPGAAGYNHSEQEKGNCGICHSLHDEKLAHDAHVQVSCEACHLADIVPVKDRKSGVILWKKPGSAKSGASNIHEMIIGGETETCARCHQTGNTLGATSWILPPKGILCMPCHAATFSVSDTFTILGLGLFIAGLIIAFSYIFSRSDKDTPTANSGKGRGNHPGTARHGRFTRLLKALFLDVFLQRRLFVRSQARWFIHGLVFYGFFFRFLWGMVALIASLLDPPWEALRFMLDKNNPATGMVFDISGLMILLGLCLMLVRGLLTPRLPGLPAQDRFALGLIGALVIIGFVTEGLRIAMTGFPEGSDWSFAGYGIGLIFSDSQKLSGVYGYLWYIHAALTAAFVAYIPFSRLFHIIISPAVLALGALKRH